MKVIVRTDASVKLGHGHVMRCLSLAAGLRKRGATVHFVCRELDGHKCDLIGAHGFAVHRIPISVTSWQDDAALTSEVAGEANADWLVVDHYGLDARWESAVAPRDGDVGMAVIDDLADRSHDCDILLDQNYYRDPERRYSGLIPACCTRFFGPEFALLREEFGLARSDSGTGAARTRRLLIFFGGGDPDGHSETALDAALDFDPAIAVDVILGSDNPRAERMLARHGNRPNVNLMRTTSKISSLMGRATLCLGAGGIATFERLYMGLPSIVVATAQNQKEPLEELARAGCIEYLGEASQVDRGQWLAALRQWFRAPRKLATLAVASRTDRFAAAFGIGIVPFVEHHISATFDFMRSRDLRDAFAMQEEPRWEQHVVYWKKKLASKDEAVFAVERFGEHVGNCGIKPMANGAGYEGWIYLSPGVERRSGIGEVAFRRLMRVAFRRLGLERLYLHVRNDNAAALSLYCKLGFAPALEAVDKEVWGTRSKEITKLVMQA